MAKISREEAVNKIQQILQKMPKGDKRTFMLKQVITSHMNSISDKKKATAAANGLVLQFDLDVNDKIPLYKVALA